MTSRAVPTGFLLRVGVALTLVGAAVAGCGGPGGTPGGPSSSTGSPSSPETTVTGQVIEGLRPSCVVLQVPDRRYALTGEPARGLPVGARVRVSGTVRPDLVNPCGSTTFVVTTVTRL